MKRQQETGWIRHSHLFDPDEYECPVCRKRFGKTFSSCPSCGTIISSQSQKLQDDWVEEAEELDWLLDVVFDIKK